MSSDSETRREASWAVDSHAEIVDFCSRRASYRACGSPQELIGAAGFSQLQVTDVTGRFRQTCSAWLTAMRDVESQLRRELGDEDFEDELDQKESMLKGIDEGLLLRSLIIGECF